jgi:hypothetical protein
MMQKFRIFFIRCESTQNSLNSGRVSRPETIEVQGE